MSLYTEIAAAALKEMVVTQAKQSGSVDPMNLPCVQPYINHLALIEKGLRRRNSI